MPTSAVYTGTQDILRESKKRWALTKRGETEEKRLRRGGRWPLTEGGEKGEETLTEGEKKMEERTLKEERLVLTKREEWRWTLRRRGSWALTKRGGEGKEKTLKEGKEVEVGAQRGREMEEREEGGIRWQKVWILMDSQGEERGRGSKREVGAYRKKERGHSRRGGGPSCREETGGRGERKMFSFWRER